MTPERIFASSPNIAPDTANRFVQVLTAQTTRLAKAPGMSAGKAPAQEVESGSSVQTFGLPDPDDGEKHDPNF